MSCVRAPGGPSPRRCSLQVLMAARPPTDSEIDAYLPPARRY